MKKRLGGKGLSLDAFVAARGRPHNPSEIKKKREVYQNAKKVQKYKKLKKELQFQTSEGAPVAKRPDPTDTEEKPVGRKVEVQREATVGGEVKRQGHRRKGDGSLGKLRNEYEKKQRELQEAKEQRDKEIAERRQAREQAQQRRKEIKAKMFKKTSRGQPVMKHRLEQILNSVGQ